jgi:hypothetical protein
VAQPWGSTIVTPISSLKPDVERYVGLWDRQVLTLNETTGWLVDTFAFVLQDFPHSHPTVAEALDTVPLPLIVGMTERLNRSRLEGSGWHWPPAGTGLPDPGPIPPWGMAGPAEAEVLEVLACWLRDRTDRR